MMIMSLMMRPSEVTHTWTSGRAVCRLFRNAVEKVAQNSILTTLAIQFTGLFPYIAVVDGLQHRIIQRPQYMNFDRICDENYTRALFYVHVAKVLAGIRAG